MSDNGTTQEKVKMQNRERSARFYQNNADSEKWRKILRRMMQGSLPNGAALAKLGKTVEDVNEARRLYDLPEISMQDIRGSHHLLPKTGGGSSVFKPPPPPPPPPPPFTIDKYLGNLEKHIKPATHRLNLTLLYNALGVPLETPVSDVLNMTDDVGEALQTLKKKNGTPYSDRKKLSVVRTILLGKKHNDNEYMKNVKGNSITYYEHLACDMTDCKKV